MIFGIVSKIAELLVIHYHITILKYDVVPRKTVFTSRFFLQTGNELQFLCESKNYGYTSASSRIKNMKEHDTPNTYGIL